MRGRRRAGLRAEADHRPVRGQTDTVTSLHEERLDSVVSALLRRGAATVLDLGCGSGALLRRLAERERFTRIVGLDSSPEALAEARRLLTPLGTPGDGRVSLVQGSFLTVESLHAGFDATTLVETIEHVEPGQLSAVEKVVFAKLRPATVVITTPNVEYNVLYGLASGELRHRDHRFEWSRSRFRSWAVGVAERHGYRAVLEGIGRPHPWLGSPTQMGVFALET
jgi:small RNA 2'-O-methyltransferase